MNQEAIEFFEALKQDEYAFTARDKEMFDVAMDAVAYDDVKYHMEHNEVIVEREVWEDAKRALEQEPSVDAVSRQAVLDLAKFDERKGLGTIIHALDVEQLPSVNPQKWIPVSERLPQVNEWVLCQCRAGYKVLRLTSYGCYCNDTQEYMDSFVIAWMPLPKPYKDGGE